MLLLFPLFRNSINFVEFLSFAATRDFNVLCLTCLTHWPMTTMMMNGVDVDDWAVSLDSLTIGAKRETVAYQFNGSVNSMRLQKRRSSDEILMWAFKSAAISLFSLLLLLSLLMVVVLCFFLTSLTYISIVCIYTKIQKHKTHFVKSRARTHTPFNYWNKMLNIYINVSVFLFLFIFYVIIFARWW